VSSTGQPGRWARVPAATAALLLASCLVSACVSIPQSSPVSPGRSAGVQDSPQHVTNDPAGPTPGATPFSIAQGFFAAMLAYPQTMATARAYLTTSAAAHWDPTDHVVVYDTLSSTQNRAGVMVSAHALGRLDTRGAWQPVATRRAQMNIELRLVREDREWRIANPPPGLYVDSDYFLSNYGDFSLYFFDPSHAVLAADPVYLVDDDTAATALVNDLIKGPTESLRGAVVSAAPQQTKVAVSVATARSGQADVPLSDEILKLSADQRRLFAAQLAWTLRQLPDVHSVSISVDGVPVDIPGFGTDFGVNEFQGYDPAGLTGERRLFALSPKGLVAVTPVGLAPVLSATPAVRDARSVAIDTKGALAALVSKEGTAVGVYSIPESSDSTRADWIEGATSLLRPSWDFSGVLWAVDDTPDGAVVYAATADHQRVVAAPGLAGRDIVSFGVSRDGVRFAAIVREGASTRLVISVIHRDPDHPDRVRLAPPRTVLASEVTLSDLSQLAWVSPTAVVLLAKADGGARQPWQLTIDGSGASDVGEFLHARPVALAAGSNVDAPIAVGVAGGSVFVQQSDLQWLQIGAGTALRAPVYAG
jgi:hypothetical protein